MPETELTSPILEFYNDSRIFITGGTGFLGKVIIEKLLRLCTNTHIYLLIRMKKGKNPDTRLKELFEDPLFEILRKEKPSFEKNVTCISGDLIGLRLSMSDSDYEYLTNEVTHVFHSGATVRFNEHLKSAVNINVKGTEEIVTFCKKCRRLKVFVHVSTAYSNCVSLNITEEFYDPPLAPEKLTTLVDTLSEDKLNSLTQELIKPWPNTYSYTKAIAENVIKENAKSMPALVFRPSIVIGTVCDPVQGWIDNIYGPTGVIAGAAVGLVRVVYAKPDLVANVVPVDLTVNAMLSCAWDVGSNFNSNNIIDNSLTESTENIGVGKKTETLPKIFNFSSDEVNNITWGKFLQNSLKIAPKMPVEKAIWCCMVTLTSNKWHYSFLTLFLHILPGYLIDLCSLLIGKKPQMVKTYQKIRVFLDSLAYFSVTNWEISDHNTRKVWSRLSDKDKKLFNFDMKSIDWNFYTESILKGIRIYIIKETMDSIPAAKRKLFFFYLGHRLIQFVFIALAFWVLSKFFFPYERLKTYILDPYIDTGIFRNST